MTLHERLTSNRELLGIPDPEQLRHATLDPERVAQILTRTIALIDAIGHLEDQLHPLGLQLVRELADDVETSIAQAVLTAR